MGSREKRASFEAINGLKLGLLEAKNGGSGLWNSKPDIVALVFISKPSHVPGKNGDRSSH
jgi:hypothetical protein